MKKSTVSREKTQLQLLGRVFRNARLDQQLKLGELADKSGVSSLTISKLEKGELDNSSLQTLNKIAEVLKLKVTLSAN